MEASKEFQGFNKEVQQHTGGTVQGPIKRGFLRIFATGLSLFKMIEPSIPILTEIGAMILKGKGYDAKSTNRLVGLVALADLVGKGLDFFFGKKLRSMLGDEGTELLGQHDLSPASIMLITLNGGLTAYQAHRAISSYTEDKKKKEVKKQGPESPKPEPEILKLNKAEAVVYEAESEHDYTLEEKIIALHNRIKHFGVWYEMLFAKAIDILGQKKNIRFVQILNLADRLLLLIHKPKSIKESYEQITIGRNGYAQFKDRRLKELKLKNISKQKKKHLQNLLVSDAAVAANAGTRRQWRERIRRFLNRNK